MILGRLRSAPEKRVPAAMAMVSTGLLLVVLGVVWGRFGLAGSWGASWNDFARGFLFGLGITLEVAGVVLVMSARRRATKA